MKKSFVLCAVCAALTFGAMASSQAAPGAYEIKPYAANTAQAQAKRQGVTSQIVRANGAPWMRLQFGELSLSEGSQLRITSLQDGQRQHLNAQTMKQWQGTSAYFNGDAVRVELIPAAGARGDRFSVRSLMVGTRAAVAADEGGSTESVCGSDDRAPSALPYAARLGLYTSAALTADGCLVSAGSTFWDSGWIALIEFNVPPSDKRGMPRVAAVKDQYVVSTNAASMNELTEDWSVFQVLPNTETGLMPAQAQNNAGLPLAMAAPTVGQATQVVGFAKNESKRTMNYAQQSAMGTITAVDAGLGTISYDADTESGSGGSPVVVDGKIAGVHVFAGCFAGEAPARSKSLLTGQPKSANHGVMLGTNANFMKAYNTVCKGPGVVRPTCKDFKSASLTCSSDMPGAVELNATLKSSAFSGQMLQFRIDGDMMQAPIQGDMVFMGIIGTGTSNTHTVTLEDPKGCPRSTRTVTCE